MDFDCRPTDPNARLYGMDRDGELVPAELSAGPRRARPVDEPPRTREPQYAACFDEPPVTLGPMTGATWRWNPRRLGMMLARYKFCAQMLKGLDLVAEIGCADAFGSEVVRREVGELTLFDFDDVWWPSVQTTGLMFVRADIVASPLPWRSNAIYMLDVLEHIKPEDESAAMRNICGSLKDDGVFIAGCPTLESQVYASDISKAGHVNCKTGDKLRADAMQYFRNVFLFGMNDEMLHCGFPQMCHYHFILCTGPQR